MAIGRVAGPSLISNLDRQGVDLQFSTNNLPLFYLDFANFKAAINSNTLNTSATFTVNGNVLLSNIKIDNTTISSDNDITLSAAGNVLLGNISQVKIDGGSDNYLMTTDGSGNLSWQDISTISSEMHLAGQNVIIGEVTDSSLIDYSAYRYWTSNTSISDAVDNLNQVMLNVYQNTYVGSADFTANIVAGPSPMTVSFTANTLGNPTIYEWDFGDGFTSSLRNPTHTYSNTLGGSYTVYFKASNPSGTRSASGHLGDGHLAQGSYADTNKVSFITLYTPLPVPSFTIDDTSIDSTSSIVFTNTSQYASSYDIHWGDGYTTNVLNNSSPGGVGGGTVSHTYTNTNGDTLYQVWIAATSPTAGPSGATISSSTTAVRVYSIHTPLFVANKSSGNNQHTTTPNGLVVGFTNTTGTHPGITSLFPNNRLQWNWGDGTTANVIIGSGSVGDLGQVITHPYTLTDPKVQQVFHANLQVFNDNTTSPYTSSDWPITVYPAPTALFSGNVVTLSDRSGDTLQTGYDFTDLLGNDRRVVTFTNTSINADTYMWSYGDSTTSASLSEGVPGTPTGSTLNHAYTTTGTFSVSLLSHGASSLSPTDDTLIKSNYITILPAPSAPSGLNSKTISLTSVGSSPLLAANATDNTIGSIPAAGTLVTRITTINPIATTLVSNVYNSSTGTISAVINGTPETPVALSGADDTGTYGSLIITEDKDAHSLDATVYPSNFYKVFSGKISRNNSAVSVGYNSYQISHSSTGNTNVLGFVKDDVTQVPTLDTTLVTATTTSLGTPRYISGIPYFNTGGTIAIHGLTASNWIGQTYLNTTTPFTVSPSTTLEGTGTAITSQSKTYAQLDGSISYLSSGIPKANTGKTTGSAYLLGAIPVTINGTSASASKISLQLANVNGLSTQVDMPVEINVYSSAINGFDETSIPVSQTLGGSFTDNGKRIYISGAAGLTPTVSSITNYYTSSPFVGNVTMTGTDEAVVRFGTLAKNTTNYSLFLPAGPDLSGRAGLQYFRFAFRRTTVANFTLTYSGKISGLAIAAPGTQIDTTSTLNKWLNSTIVYAGAGIPGANVSTGGNGSNGCAKSAGDVVPVGQLVTNRSCVLTLGSANSSDATGNEILVCIALDVGDSITSISIS